MRSVLSLLFFIVLILMTGPVQSFAESIRLVSGEWPPYCSQNPEQPGITTEIVLSAFEAVGVKTRLDFFPWPRCERMVCCGMDVIAFPYVQTAARDQFALFSIPMLTEKTYLYYSRRHMSHFDFTGYKQLQNYRVGTLNGFVHQELFEENRVDAAVVKNNTVAMRMLLMNRLQLFPINDLVARQEIHDNFSDKEDEFSHSKTPMYTVPLRLMVSRKNPQAERLLSLFAKGMSIIQRKGIIDKIMSKYK